MKTISFPLARLLLAAAFAWLASGEISATTYYVKPLGSDSNAGTSWAAAFLTVQKAIDIATASDQIWVAAGTYRPTATHGGSTDRHKTFFFDENLKIYGGFAGTETMLSQRNWTTNLTILSGDLGTANNTSDNAYHVVWIDHRTSAMELDGFKIEKGNANAADPANNGGGIYNDGGGSGQSSNPTIANCTFSANLCSQYGGGLYNAGSCSSTLTNCTFTGNNSDTHGGGLYNRGSNSSNSSPTLTGCTFTSNTADDGGALYNYGVGGNSSPALNKCSFAGNSASANGGAIYNNGSGSGGDSNPVLTNCAFSGNLCTGGGGAIYNYGNGGTCTPTLTNCSFSGNAGTPGGAFRNNAGTPTLKNCILWGDNSEFANTNGGSETVTYSIVEGGHAGTGNLDVDPLFVNQPDDANAPTTAGNLHLTVPSPAVNTGTNTGAPPADYDGDARPIGGTVDMGFDERPNCFAGTRIYVNANAPVGGGGSSWATALQSFQHALDLAEACTGLDEIWVANGTYKPSVPHDGTTDLHKTFFIDFDIKIYGGFAGTETLLSQRNWVANPTILSGDIGTVGDNSDNCYHVLWMHHLPATAVLDGFTIEKGNANLTGSFIGSRGGGIFNDGSGSGNSSNPTIANCSFSGNSASSNGGAMYNHGFSGTSSPSLTNCSFSGNSASSDGGAMYNYATGGTSSPSLTNCSFSGNKATGFGGAMRNHDADPVLKNCILWGNSSEISNPTGSSATVTYSIVQGGYTGTGNLNADPLFVNQPPYANAPTTAGDLHLQAPSPAINAGTASGAPTTDFDGDARPIGAGFDMGFDERPGCPAAGGTVIFVDASAPANGDGSSWATAFQNLQPALDLAKICPAVQEIWVADGTYKPTVPHGGSTDRYKTFFLDFDIKIYGGFAGGETMLSQRNWTTNVAILSGDLGTANVTGDNAYHVIWIDHRTSAMQLDGLKIEKGNANGTFPASNGGGIYNEGINYGFSDPTIANCTFNANQCSVSGGGMFNFGAYGGDASPTLTNCVFAGNSSSSEGGGLANVAGDESYANPTLTNCAFLGNSAANGGGAVHNANEGLDAVPTFTNCVFSGNTAVMGGAMFNDPFFGANPIFKNCILWGNSSEIINGSGGTATVTYSIVQGGCPAGANCTNVLNVDPLFVSQPPVGLGTTGNLHLLTNSPAIHAGTSSGAPATDFDGDVRPFGAGFDMGFDEVVVPCPAGSVIFVDASAPPNGNGATWATALQNFQLALDLAKICPAVLEIWVADGTYKPSVPHGGSTDRHKTFFLDFDTKIYGGFNGGEASVAARPSPLAVSTLSGDLGSAGNSDNAYHVLWLQLLSSAMILDGFTVTAGNANGTTLAGYGGGIYNDGSVTLENSNPALANCTFSGNAAAFSGGAIYNNGVDGDASPSLTNCSFLQNTAALDGGAMFSNGSSGKSSPMLSGCSFSQNTADVGGAMSNFGGSGGESNPSLTNCSFKGNSATTSGGAVNNSSGSGVSSPTFTNCAFSGNLSDAGGAIYNDAEGGNCSPGLVNCSFSGNSSASGGGAVFNFGLDGVCLPTLTNCILWGNSSEIENVMSTPTVTYSIVQGGHAGTGNLNANPLFISQPPVGLGTAGDLRLQACSPAAEAGSDAANATTADPDGNPRKTDAVTGGVLIDMGAYEYQSDLDADNDTYTYCGGIDCNDANAAIHPGAAEICNGLDDDCNGSPESPATTWTGAGDGVNWSSGGNWSDGFVPLPCQDVIIPATGNVTVAAGFAAMGRTLDVALGAVLEVAPTGVVDIHN